MSENLFLQFQNSNPDQLLWFHLVDEQLKQSGTQAKQSLSELKEMFPTASCIVLVPSKDCLVTTVALPTRQRRQLLKAIPFALEEQLADNIDDMHFAIGKRRDDDSLPITAVTKSKMNYWLDTLDGTGLSIKYLLPLTSLLEAPQDAWSVFHFNDDYLVNQNGNCWLGSEDDVELMLNLSIQQLDEKQQPGLLYWSEQQTPSWIDALGLEVANQTINNSEQALLSRFDNQKTNLLQGDFSIKDDWNATWLVWRKVAVVALVAILLKFSMMGFEVFRLNGENSYLKTEMARQYHLIVPSARITKNLERQMKQLISQRQGGGNQSNSFLMMFALVADSITSIPGIQPTNLNYDSKKGEIRLDLLMANLPQLDQLKDKLVSKGLSIEVGAASAQGSSYSGRLTIRGGS